MTNDELKEKLRELGITTSNCYPKKSFIKNEMPVVGLYARELVEDFFFYNEYNKGIFKVPSGKDNYDYDSNTEKYLIPVKSCELIWEDKPYEELPDKGYREMTLREYACIMGGVPESGLPWLDEIIKKSTLSKGFQQTK